MSKRTNEQKKTIHYLPLSSRKRERIPQHTHTNTGSADLCVISTRMLWTVFREHINQYKRTCTRTHITNCVKFVYIICCMSSLYLFVCLSDWIVYVCVVINSLFVCVPHAHTAYASNFIFIHFFSCFRCVLNACCYFACFCFTVINSGFTEFFFLLHAFVEVLW